MLQRMLTLVVKELQSLVRGKESVQILVMPVILYLALFPFAATLEVKNSTLAIYNQDGGAASVELIQRLSAARAFPHLLMVYGESALQAAIDNQDALLAIRVPQDFSRKLAAGQPAALQAIIDGRRSNGAQIAFGYAQLVVQQYALEQGRGRGISLPANVAVQNLYNPNLEYYWFILPSLVGIIATIGCLMVTALSLAREREEGTFDQLLVTPLTPAYIMAGKAVPGVLVALFQAGMIAAGAVYIYHVPYIGGVGLLFLALFCYALSLCGIGLFISAICSTQQQAFLGVFAFIMPAIIISGYMAPVENMPLPFQWLSAVDPVTHMIIIAKGIFLKGYGFDLVWPHLWPLLLITVGNLALAYRMFLHRNT